MNSSNRFKLPLLLLSLLFFMPAAQAQDLAKGVVIERVVCVADAGQSYALYLPSNYTTQKQWPIIYAFDPTAQGTAPVNLFKEAAEKYGYIVAASHNSQNGMQSGPLQAAIKSILTDTRKRLSIDARRIYTAGFSGGARVATRVASSCGGCIAGVIACGAGFPSDITPSDATRFAFYGTIGVDDYNYPELKRLDDKLSSLALPHHIAAFEGGHQWATPPVLGEAVEWLELQAMRAGRRELDKALVEVLWQKALGRARADEEARRFYEAYKGYAALAADFSQLKDVAEYEKKAAALKETKEVKQALKAEQEQIEKQLELAASMINLGSKLLNEPSERTEALKELRVIVEGLRKKATATEDSGERRIARRALRHVLAQTSEAAMFNYHPNRQYEIALVNLEVASVVSPNNPFIPYEMARAYALRGEKKKALESLKLAVEKGFQGVATIAGQKDFDSLRAESEYQSIIKTLNDGKLSK